LQTREQSATYIISLKPPSEPPSYPIIEATAIGSSEMGIKRGLELIQINILGSNPKESLGERPKFSQFDGNTWTKQVGIERCVAVLWRVKD
jgi:hypothetical protein